MYEPIAIIGYGVLYPPNSDNVQNFWKNIKNGVQGIREVTNEVWNVNDYYNEDENVPDKTYCKNSAYLDNTGSLMDYISKFNLDDGKILSLNRTKKMVLYTILQAIDEANLNINELRDSSLIIGNMLGDLDISDYMLYKFGKNYLNEVEKSSLVQRGSLEKITDKFGSRLYEELDLEDRNIDGMFPIDSKINPILIDNVGRLMLLNEFYQNGNTVVPTFISKTISLESFNIGEKVKAYVEKVAENGDEVIYDAFVFNESKLLLIIEQMHLTKVGQTSDYEIEI